VLMLGTMPTAFARNREILELDYNGLEFLQLLQGLERLIF